MIQHLKNPVNTFLSKMFCDSDAAKYLINGLSGGGSRSIQQVATHPADENKERI